jgi:glutamyl-tRNA synthetase
MKLSDADRKALEAQGHKPHWRFKLAPGTVRWSDVIHGEMAVPAESLSDPVVVREDGTPLYVFTSVVDDIDFGVSHIIRGDEHLMNTVPQLQLFAALGVPAPVFAHFALLVGPQGEKLSKRLGALSLAELREQGIEPLAIASLLARLGSADPVEPRASLAELVEGFDLSRFGRAPAHFDPDELTALNAKVLHELPYTAVAARLTAWGIVDAQALWHAVRGNLTTLAEMRDWATVVAGPLAGTLEDRAFTDRAAAVLPAEPWTDATWPAWTRAVTEATGAKGRALFHPLRLALTGRDNGPEMKFLLPLNGRERALARLRGQAA